MIDGEAERNVYQKRREGGKEEIDRGERMKPNGNDGDAGLVPPASSYRPRTCERISTMAALPLPRSAAV